MSGDFSTAALGVKNAAININSNSTEVYGIKISQLSGYGVIFSANGVGGFSITPLSSSTKYLYFGNLLFNNSTYKLSNVKILNNGADLAVPTEGGTLARLEDLEGIGGGASLPDQTDNAGKFLTTDGTTASWSEYLYITRQSVGIGTANTPYSAAVAIGGGTTASASGAIASGYNARATSLCAIACGAGAKATAANAIQLGANRWTGGYTNSDANTFKVGNENGNFEMMSADGTIPAARHAALPTEDGTYVLKLVIADGVPTLQWIAE